MPRGDRAWESQGLQRISNGVLGKAIVKRGTKRFMAYKIPRAYDLHAVFFLTTDTVQAHRVH